MRILQLIDSLESGGAERMAVNFANAFAKQGDFSALIATRKEGDLKESLLPTVAYNFLSRNKTIDFEAVLRLRKFVKSNRIEIIQAHGTSIFIAGFLKILCPGIKLFWHDHNGNRAKLSEKANRVIIGMSFLFDGVLCVNEELKEWAQKKLKTKKVHYLPNFTLNLETLGTTKLKGEEHKRIVCLANLREPKNHHRLVVAFYESGVYRTGWSLHLVGRDLHDDYSKSLKDLILSLGIVTSVYIYGSKPDVHHILSQATIGVLVSTHEGFPVTLLEYGLSNLAVIASNVGYCNSLITDDRGLLTEPLEIDTIAAALKEMILNENMRIQYSKSLNQFVLNEFSETCVLHQLRNIFN